MYNYDLIVVGAGASGIIAAITAKSKKNIKVLIIEKENKIARKVLMAGNGRCNLYNTGNYIYYGNQDFAEKVLGENCADFMYNLFSHLGINPVIDAAGRAYPSTYQGETVVDALTLALDRLKIDIRLSESVNAVLVTGDSFLVRTDKSDYSCNNVVLAPGSNAGLNKLTNSLDIINNIGLDTIDFSPALCPIVCDNTEFKSLSGLRIKASLFVDNKYSTHGEILFTDYGISGIASMQLAVFLKKDSLISIDFREYLGLKNAEEDKIISILEKRIHSYPDDNTDNLLVGLCNKKISRVLLKRAGIYVKGSTFQLIKKDDIIRLAKTICNFEIKAISTREMKYAQVAKGGVETSQINPFTMQSSIKGLYITGEAINVDGDTGGYNLMFAFKSGYNAGCDISSKM